MNELEIQAKEDHWRSIQEEFPGITRKAYEAELEESTLKIQAKFYDKDGRLKDIKLVTCFPVGQV